MLSTVDLHPSYTLVRVCGSWWQSPNSAVAVRVSDVNPSVLRPGEFGPECYDTGRVDTGYFFPFLVMGRMLDSRNEGLE